MKDGKFAELSIYPVSERLAGVESQFPSASQRLQGQLLSKELNLSPLLAFGDSPVTHQPAVPGPIPRPGITCQTWNRDLSF